MAFLDIHSHILPQVDDGAKDIETSIKLLEMLKEQSVTDVIATPHFYPDEDNAEEFIDTVENAYNNLKKETLGKDLPNVYLGCELRYFNGIGKSETIKQFTIAGTNYLLLELPYDEPIKDFVLQDIIDINERLGLIPILAHIERYGKVKGYKKLLKLISNGDAVAHINAGGVINKETTRLCEKLIKGGYVSFLASDTHSVHNRPPYIKAALDMIADRLGRSAANRLIIKSNALLEEIEAANE
ncbi:MAG: hypothetical protein IKT42_03570 [Clostridia bacterium]|nr:hypothetical protein [Clostridia bacterium]